MNLVFHVSEYGSEIEMYQYIKLNEDVGKAKINVQLAKLCFHTLPYGTVRSRLEYICIHMQMYKLFHGWRRPDRDLFSNVGI